MKGLRYWALGVSFSVLLVAVGCGGSGGGNGGGGGGGPVAVPSGNSTAFVTLPNLPATADFLFLTGAGRAEGDIRAFIDRVSLNDSNGLVQTILAPDLTILLSGYTLNSKSLKVPTTGSSRLFDMMPFEIDHIEVEQSGGGINRIPVTDTGVPLVDIDVPANIRTFPGRTTAIQVYLDDSILNDTNTDYLDQTQFDDVNLDPSTNMIEGRLSDYIRFDISSMASGARPSLEVGGPASRVYFSGDTIALSAGGSTGFFEVVTNATSEEGSFAPPGTGTTFGTYQVNQIDPRDIDLIDTIVALRGAWYDYTTVIGGLGEFEFITFPNSEDDEFQDLIIIERSGTGVITNCYWGAVDFDAGTFTAYPISTVKDVSPAGGITGTVSQYLNSSGTLTTTPSAIRSGTFEFDGGAPGSFPDDGRFIVFRI